MENQLELKGIHKKIKNNFFSQSSFDLVDISIVFKKATINALLGKNGTGKTTTLKIILSLLKKDKGEIFFSGQTIDHNHRQKISYMPEIQKLHSSLNLKEIIDLHCKLYSLKIDKDFIEASIKSQNLWDHKHKKISQLSKGMKRKVSWILANITKPDLYILDEPFEGLDPSSKEDLMRDISNKKKEGKTFIISTHEVQTILPYCDTMTIIDKGRIIKHQSIDFAIKNKFEIILSQEDHLKLIQKKPLPTLKFDFLIFHNKECQRYQVKSYEEAHKLLTLICDLKLTLLSFSEKQANLDELFT